LSILKILTDETLARNLYTEYTLRCGLKLYPVLQTCTKNEICLGYIVIFRVDICWSVVLYLYVGMFIRNTYKYYAINSVFERTV